MTDPKRWCDDPQALSQMEQRVLLADARLGPPPQAKSEVWASLSAGLGAGATGLGVLDHLAAAPNGSESLAAAGTAAGGGTAGGVLQLAAVVKSALVVVGIGASVVAVNHYVASGAGTRAPWSQGFPSASAAASIGGPSASANESTRDAPVLDERVSTPPGPITEPDTSGAERARSSGRMSTVATSASPSAHEESQLIGSARTALRAGDATGALQLLDRVERRYPQGVLVQEREALRVEALAALGRTAEAKARADAFVRVYPKSPHVARVNSFTVK
jgi:hypothetical protein